jgi:RNA polymerase sigma factor (sigma-70 family)
VSISAEFNDKNQELFRQRFAVQAQIAELEVELAAANAPKSRAKKSTVDTTGDTVAEPDTEKKAPKRRPMVIEHDLRIAKRELDTVTTAIIDLNYGLVLNYVRKFTSTTNREDSRDFEGAAVLGLMKAISSYDPVKGSKFSTWAYKPIQRECLKAVRDADFKQLNPGDFEKRPDILRARKELQDGNDEFNPAFEDIAALAGTTVDTVRRVINAPRLESLAKPVHEDGKSFLGDTIPDTDPSVEDNVIASQELTDLEEFGLRTLDERELFVISRRFGLDAEPPQRLSAIGNILGLSREAVRQVESKALSKLNHPVVRRKLIRHGRV